MSKNGWQDFTLGDLIQNKSKRFEFKNKQKVVFINTGDILKGIFLHENKISSLGLPGQAKKAISKNDILFSEIRPANGRFALVEFDSDIHVVSTKFMVLSLISKEVYLKYVYLILTSNLYLSEFQRIAESRSGTFPQITFDAISYLPISLPPLPIQKTITKILGDLDARIELNRKMNENLEAIAQALFQSWFVDFDPVLDNFLVKNDNNVEALPAPLRKNGAIRLEISKKNTPKTNALFPSNFIFNEVLEKWIPEGWDVKSFGEVSQCFDSKRIPLSKKQREEKKPGIYPYHGATSINDYINEYVFDDTYLLLGEDGSVIKENGTPFIQYVWGKIWVNNHAHVLKGINGISTEHLMTFIRQQNMTAYITGAVQLKINQGNMNSIPFLFSSASTNASFSKELKDIYQKYKLNSNQALSLTKLRDTLLPQLISGKLNVPRIMLEIKKAANQEKL